MSSTKEFFGLNLNFLKFLRNLLDKNTLFYSALRPQSQVQVEAECPALCLLLLFLINIWFFRPNHGGINLTLATVV